MAQRHKNRAGNPPGKIFLGPNVPNALKGPPGRLFGTLFPAGMEKKTPDEIRKPPVVDAEGSELSKELSVTSLEAKLAALEASSQSTINLINLKNNLGKTNDNISQLPGS